MPRAAVGLLHCLWESLAGSCQRASYFLCGHSIHSLPIGTRIHKLQNPPKHPLHTFTSPLHTQTVSNTRGCHTSQHFSGADGSDDLRSLYMRKYLCQSSSTRETKAPCSHASRSLSEGIMLRLRGSSIKGGFVQKPRFYLHNCKTKGKKWRKITAGSQNPRNAILVRVIATYKS